MMNPSLNLLILEDDPADAELVQELLRRSGMQFNSRVAGDEREFLEALDANGYDIVLADNALPQYSSLEALEVIKQKNPYVAFILVTGTVSEEFAVKIIQQGADDYILKTNLTRLPAAINKAVEGKRVQKEKRTAEKEMLELNQQLHELTAHLQQVREEEQTRIAREIHDQLGQMLTALKIDISSADKKLPKSIVEAKAHLLSAMNLADETIKIVRQIAAQLRPDILDHLGLVAALEWQTEEFKKHNEGIRCIFTSSVPEINLGTDVATGLYRIYQEALTNIARHSGATEVLAYLDCKKDEIKLTVSDNGNGFDAEIIKAKKSFGLVGMKERALLMQGHLVIDSIPGKRTTIVVNVPLE